MRQLVRAACAARQVTSVAESTAEPSTGVQGLLGLMGILAVPVVGYSMYTLYKTGDPSTTPPALGNINMVHSPWGGATICMMRPLHMRELAHVPWQ